MRCRTSRLAPCGLLALLLALLAGPAGADPLGPVPESPRCRAWSQTLALLEAVESRRPAVRRLLPGIDRRLLRMARRYADRCVRLNQVQVLGSHNSYHVEPVQRLIDLYLNFDAAAIELQYSHRPIGEQLSQLGVRQLELDVFADPVGGRYAEPFGLKVRENDLAAREPRFDPPGLKVFHIQELDWDTTCHLLVDCLEQVRDWSDANPGHLPVTILVEVKDAPIDDPLGLGWVQPLFFGAAELDELDAVVRSVFPPEQLITPDDVRGGLARLEDAVLARGWPTLGEARGRVLFALDNGGKRPLYLAGHPSLAGRVLFTDAPPGADDAAFVKVNGPVGNQAAIEQLVRDGYLVRTRADAGTLEARAGDTTRRDVALASGAQLVSTDYAEPDPRFGPYVVAIPDGMPGRCNPVSAPPGCRDHALEP